MSHPITKSLVIAALLSSGAAYAGTPGWQVSEISGNVTVARKGVVKIAQRQTKLAPGDVIKTGPKGRAVLLRGGEYLVVSPASHIEIAAPEKSGKVTQIIEYLGNVLFRIDKKETPHFGVKTPYMAAVVKGTTFSVSVSAEGSAVQVTEGAVEVFTLDEGASELVTPGVIGMINANDPFSLVVIDGERRVIESPNKPANSDDVKVTAAPAVAATGSSASGLSGTISVPISEEGVELAELTNGLIRGDVSYNRFVFVENAEESVGAGEDVVDATSGEEEIVSEIIADDEKGEADQGDEGQGDEGQGDDDQGDDDQGDDDQGDDDQGDDDQGDDDQGDDDQGDDDQGDDDQGDDDQGDDDQGDDDQGDDDQGDDDQGEDDQGDDDQGEDNQTNDENMPGNGDANSGQDDGNNGHGNDPDGFDDSNPGQGNGKGQGKGGNDDDDGNNGHGNDPDGFDDSNPGKGGGKGKGKGKNK
ncbi:FecR domain-containing protein [Sphingorhabdus sp. Alg231-15]|uniref:FecR domain-containing protein n=1 Tax=Sphingorhabdus sp. Alg231-15 TaxID=1922222 RepID=UPI000D552DC1